MSAALRNQQPAHTLRDIPAWLWFLFACGGFCFILTAISTVVAVVNPPPKTVTAASPATTTTAVPTTTIPATTTAPATATTAAPTTVAPTQPPTTPTTPTPTEPPTTVPTTPPPLRWNQGADITEANVRDSLHHPPKDLVGTFTTDNPTTVTVVDDVIVLEYHATERDLLSAVDTIRKGAPTTYVAMHALFTNPRVQSVTVNITADFQDQLGNSKSETAAGATFDLDTIAKINWDGFADRITLDPDTLYCAADAHTIHPAILKDVGSDSCLRN